jgi:hypothetical protein
LQTISSCIGVTVHESQVFELDHAVSAISFMFTNTAWFLE